MTRGSESSSANPTSVAVTMPEMLRSDAVRKAGTIVAGGHVEGRLVPGGVDLVVEPRAHVEDNGATGWSEFGRRFGKTPQAVQKRWREQLDPDIKWGAFDARETEILRAGIAAGETTTSASRRVDRPLLEH